MTTKAKPRDLVGDLPLYPTRERVMRETGLGGTSIDKLEREGLLRPVKLGSLRVKRYHRSDVLALAGVDPPEADSEADPAAAT